VLYEIYCNIFLYSIRVPIKRDMYLFIFWIHLHIKVNSVCKYLILQLLLVNICFGHTYIHRYDHFSGIKLIDTSDQWYIDTVHSNANKHVDQMLTMKIHLVNHHDRAGSCFWRALGQAGRLGPLIFFITNNTNTIEKI
jgi:hypothetical protein